MEEIRLHQGKHYKGSIRWFKLRLSSGVCKVEKRRPFGSDSKRITQEEFDWITDARRAEKMWGFYHYYNTATWFGGELKHPITGLGYVKETANA